MSKIGLIVTINKIDESVQTTFICSTLNECYIELINHIAKIFNILYIDFPINLEDFEYIWFKQEYTKNNSFVYSVFENNKWINPWTYEDIYSDVLTKMEALEIANKTNMELDSDESDDEVNKNKHMNFYE